MLPEVHGQIGGIESGSIGTPRSPLSGTLDEPVMETLASVFPASRACLLLIHLASFAPFYLAATAKGLECDRHQAKVCADSEGRGSRGDSEAAARLYVLQDCTAVL